MPTFLSDPSPTVYVLLTIAGLAAVALWFRSSQTTRVNLRVGLVFLLIAGWVAIDRLVESPREEAVRRVEGITAAVNARDKDGLLSHVSEKFDYHGLTREGLRNVAGWRYLDRDNVRIAAFDFSRDDVQYPDENTVVVGFLAKAEGQINSALFYVQAQFARQSDDTWLMTGFKVFADPLKRQNDGEYVVPGIH